MAMDRLYAALVAVVCLLGLLAAAEDTLVVQTKSGKVKGVRHESYSGKEYVGFHSIPYAENPTGDLRFRPPVPAEPWEGVRDATTDGPQCIQIPAIVEQGVIGDEDCLWLSVFKPDVAPDRPMPVMVWIPGGRYLVGTARLDIYSPTYMMDFGDIVVVSIQYRLGALGFLSTGDEVASGNWGLHDQVLGLKWVRDNIGSFGGDPDRVTITGHSAGSASVQTHIISPLSRGLVHGAISFAGSALSSWGSRMTTHAKVAKQQAALFGCPTDAGSQALIDCLRKVDARELTHSQGDLHVLFKRSPAKLPLATFFPRIDKEAPEPIFPRDPLEMVRSGDFATDVPYVLGVNTQEGAFMTSNFFEKRRFREIMAFARENPINFTMELTMKYETTEGCKGMLDLYLKDVPLDSQDARIPLSNLFSDVALNTDALNSAHEHARHGSAPVFLYRFGFMGQWTYIELIDHDKQDYGGVAHMDEIRYFMRMPFKQNLTEEEGEMVRRITGYVANFVRKGAPTADPEEWPAYKVGSGSFMNIDRAEESGIVHGVIPFPRERMKFQIDLLGYEDFTEDYPNDEDTRSANKHEEL